MQKKHPRTTEEIEEELQHLLYVVSHDLGKYIRHMREFTYILLEDAREKFNEEERECADMLVRAADNSNRMISALLEYSRVETQAEPPSDIDSNALLEHVRQNLASTIEAKGADIHVAALPAVTADERQLVALWGHLLHNALTFVEAGISPVIHISAQEEKRRIIFSIKDNGIGIPEDRQEHIFKLFTRLHREEDYPGIGAGLAVAKRILLRHGGEIWVESTPGEGATFSFSLPKQ